MNSLLGCKADLLCFDKLDKLTFPHFLCTLRVPPLGSMGACSWSCCCQVFSRENFHAFTKCSIDAYLTWELPGDFRSKRRFLRLEYSENRKLVSPIKRYPHRWNIGTNDQNFTKKVRRRNGKKTMTMFHTMDTINELHLRKCSTQTCTNRKKKDGSYTYMKCKKCLGFTNSGGKAHTD